MEREAGSGGESDSDTRNTCTSYLNCSLWSTAVQLTCEVYDLQWALI